MGQNLCLTRESRRELGGSMHSWTDDQAERYPTPAIALRQLKQRLWPKQMDLMKEVLDDIHSLCKRHEKKNWAIAFAVLVLFALVCQDSQISAMLSGIWEDEIKENERNGEPYDYTKARECIKAMDGCFDVLTNYFTMGYRKFNPLKDFSEDAKMGLDEDSVTFIEKVRGLAAK
ncbi:hypothetical protein GP486_007288, partial [Trichoglossum hirsutum]